jgi:hypothetical protein
MLVAKDKFNFTCHTLTTPLDNLPVIGTGGFSSLGQIHRKG